MPSATNAPSSANATEHGNAVSGVAEKTDHYEAVENLVTLLARAAEDFASRLPPNDIMAAAITAVEEWNEIIADRNFCFTEEALMRHKKLFAIISRDKEGIEKNFGDFLLWARRCVVIREQVIRNLNCKKPSPATEHAKKGSTATEHAILNEDQVSECYRRMGESLLQNDLQPHQKSNKKYHLQCNEEGRVRLSSFQRSFVDSMLRKKMGSRKVAFFIWTHGLVHLFDGATRRDVTPEMLQSALHEGLHWWSTLTTSILEYEAQPELEMRRDLASLEPSAASKRRREALRAAMDEKLQGKKLADLRDSKKRKFEDMTPTEQRCLERCETGLTEKTRRAHLVQPHKSFRGISSTDLQY